MKKLLMVFMACFSLYSCKKESSTDFTQSTNEYFKGAVEKYTSLTQSSEPSFIAGKTSITPQWNLQVDAVIGNVRQLIVPIKYEDQVVIKIDDYTVDLKDVSYLQVTKDQYNNFVYKIVKAIPNKTYLQTGASKFAGNIYVEDLNHNPIEAYEILNDGTIYKNSTSISVSESNSPSSSLVFTYTTCHTITTYIYVGNSPDPVINSTTVCTTYHIYTSPVTYGLPEPGGGVANPPSGPSGGGSSGSSTSNSNTSASLLNSLQPNNLNPIIFLHTTPPNTTGNFERVTAKTSSTSGIYVYETLEMFWDNNKYFDLIENSIQYKYNITSYKHVNTDIVDNSIIWNVKDKNPHVPNPQIFNNNTNMASLWCPSSGSYTQCLQSPLFGEKGMIYGGSITLKPR